MEITNTSTAVPVAPKRPTIFTILGFLALIGGCIKLFFVLIGGSVLIVLLNTSGLWSVGFFIVLVGLIGSLLLIIEGIGFLKMKKWLPLFIAASFVLLVINTALSYIDASNTQSLGETVFNFAIASAVVYATYKQKELFKN